MAHLVSNGAAIGNPWLGTHTPPRFGKKRHQLLESYDEGEWRLLLKVDSDFSEDADFRWGSPLGKLMFIIKKGDLESRNFYNVWMFLEVPFMFDIFIDAPSLL